MKSDSVVILGGGIGGIVAANKLRKQLPANHKVILVERNEHHSFAPSFLWLITGDRTPRQIRRPLGLHSRGVQTSAGEIGYDYLIGRTGELDARRR